MQLIRETVVMTIEGLSVDTFLLFEEKCFVKLRDAACTRLSLLNARRGGEPARLSIEEWVDAKQAKWIDKQRLANLDDLDLLLVEKLKITYVSGKGNNQLVPVLIPEGHY